MRKTKELRLLLMGRIVQQDGYIQVSKMRETRIFAIGNGTFSAMLLGVMQSRRFLRVPEGANVGKDVVEALQKMGRLVALQETPEIPACLCRNTLSDQHLFTVDVAGEGLMELSVFQGRSLMGKLGMQLALNRFVSCFPEGYVKTVVKQSRKERKQEKKQVKAERKQGKRAKRLTKDQDVNRMVQNLNSLKRGSAAKQPEVPQPEAAQPEEPKES